ncbi:MAG: hypothetical protein HY985_01515 [Magnetospirillum sp.]|nr:hypothetical protein [Magnetospirillum sp.]
MRLLLTLLLLLAACTPRAATAPGFGRAQGVNEALQIVDPRPRPAEEPAPDYDGKRADAAFTRYRDGKVFRPTAVTTSAIRAGTESGPEMSK